MGGIVEGVIAVMGLMAGVMVALTVLLSEDASSLGKGDGSCRTPRTIRPNDERVAA